MYVASKRHKSLFAPAVKDSGLNKTLHQLIADAIHILWRHHPLLHILQRTGSEWRMLEIGKCMKDAATASDLVEDLLLWRQCKKGVNHLKHCRLPPRQSPIDFFEKIEDVITFHLTGDPAQCA